MTLVERLKAVHQTLRAFEFESVADVLLAELAAGGRSAVGVGKRTEQFFGEGQAVKVLHAITSHPKYHIRSTEHLEDEEHVAWVQSLINPLVQAEMERLISDEELSRPFLDFRPQAFENVEIFARIHERQCIGARILTSIAHLASAVGKEKRVKDPESAPSNLADIRDPGDPQPRAKVSRNRLLIASIAVQLLAYARNKHCNIVQSLIGVFLYATNTPKRTVETLH